jgi:Protein of unknown function (DUF3800)
LLFFVDESWRKVDGVEVGALGAVAIPQDHYNRFCAAVYRMKQEVLGAQELAHSEIKGQRCFARAAFKHRALNGSSELLDAADGLLALLESFQIRIFVVWTTNPALLSLRQPATTALSTPYKRLLFDFRALMEREAPGQLASLNFDLRGTREDEATACTLQNYMVRTRGGWPDHFLCIPNFTVSAVSPGLQAADLVAYLGAWLAGTGERPEMQPYLARLLPLVYEYRAGTSRKRARACRRVT